MPSYRKINGSKIRIRTGDYRTKQLIHKIVMAYKASIQRKANNERPN